MRYSLLGIVLLTTTLSGCSHQGAPGSHTAANIPTTGGGMSVLARVRPKSDPATEARIAEEEQLAKQKMLEQMSKQQMAAATAQADANGNARILPKVSTDPIAPPAEMVASGDGPMFTPATSSPENNPIPSAPLATDKPSATPRVAAYSQTYSGGGGGVVPPPPPGALVPPPPAVTLTTQANVGRGYAINPYNSPELNPYGIPAPQMAFVPPVPQVQARPAGSLFGSGGAQPQQGSDDEAAAAKEDKMRDFVPITPTGMEPRSQYKQRDELKLLWKGALSNGSLSGLMKDERFAAALQHVDIGLPNSPSRGNMSVSQSTADNLFRTGDIDRRIAHNVKKAEMDVANAYYRYLHTYNRFAFAKQTVEARKQQESVASTASEKQRAAADVANAQTEADSAQDDLKAAQNELASVAGAGAARTIIRNITGVAPMLDNVAQAQSDTAGGDNSPGGQVARFFHFGKKEAAPAADGGKLAKADTGKGEARKAKEKDRDKPKKGKDKGSKNAEDLAPAPVAQASSGDKDDSPAPAPAGKAGQDIAFELKDVKVLPRKSVLSVSIRNSGSNSYSFSPDVFSISEGSHKLSEAAMRADFDSTFVQPNGEVRGTITIFGHPWNDKLAVVLSDGSHTVQLHR